MIFLCATIWKFVRFASIPRNQTKLLVKSLRFEADEWKTRTNSHNKQDNPNNLKQRRTIHKCDKYIFYHCLCHCEGAACFSPPFSCRFIVDWFALCVVVVCLCISCECECEEWEKREKMTTKLKIHRFLMHFLLDSFCLSPSIGNEHDWQIWSSTYLPLLSGGILSSTLNFNANVQFKQNAIADNCYSISFARLRCGHCCASPFFNSSRKQTMNIHTYWHIKSL